MIVGARCGREKAPPRRGLWGRGCYRGVARQRCHKAASIDHPMMRMYNAASRTETRASSLAVARSRCSGLMGASQELFVCATPAQWPHLPHGMPCIAQRRRYPARVFCPRTDTVELCRMLSVDRRAGFGCAHAHLPTASFRAYPCCSGPACASPPQLVMRMRQVAWRLSEQALAWLVSSPCSPSRSPS